MKNPTIHLCFLAKQGESMKRILQNSIQSLLFNDPSFQNPDSYINKRVRMYDKGDFI